MSEQSRAKVESLKVADLKDELKKRGQSVTGVKAVLVDRLLAVMAEEKQEEGAADAEGPKSPTKIDTADAVPESTKQESPVEAVEDEKPASPKRDSPEPAEASDDVKGDTEVDKLADDVPSNTTHDTKQSDDHAVEEVDFEPDHEPTPQSQPMEVEQPKAASVSTPEKATTPEPSKSDADASKPVPSEPLTSEKPPASTSSDPVPSGNKRKHEPIMFQPKPKSTTPVPTAPKTIAPTSVLATSRSIERPSKQARTVELDSRPVDDNRKPAPAVSEPTNSLLIKNFVRPFTEPMVRELLAETGTVVDFWMPPIKTHCYVIFESVEQAEATRVATFDLKWKTSKGLLPTFVTEEDARMRMDIARGIKSANGPAVSPAAASAPASARTAPGTSAPILARTAATAAAKAASGDSERSSGTRQASALLAREPSQDLERKRPAPPQRKERTLDELFKRTNATPRVYWLPLTDEQVAAKKTRLAAAQPVVQSN